MPRKVYAGHGHYIDSTGHAHSRGVAHEVPQEDLDKNPTAFVSEEAYAQLEAEEIELAKKQADADAARAKKELEVRAQALEDFKAQADESRAKREARAQAIEKAEQEALARKATAPEGAAPHTTPGEPDPELVAVLSSADTTRKRGKAQGQTSGD